LGTLPHSNLALPIFKMENKILYNLLLISFILVSYDGNNNKVEGANILFLAPLSTKSEAQFFIPLTKALALKGHSVTYVGSTKPDLKLKNFREINPVTPLLIEQFDSSYSDAVEGRRYAQEHPFEMFFNYDMSFINDLCMKTFEDPEFQSIYKESFDVVLLSATFNNCFDGLVHKFRAPLVLVSSFPATAIIVGFTGLRTPPSFVPSPWIAFTDRMTFSQRFTNFLMEWLFELMYLKVMPGDNEKIYRKYLGEDTPGMLEIERNVSLILSNSHIAVNSIRPGMPDIVEVGGLHLRPPKPLPKVSLLRFN